MFTDNYLSPQSTAERFEQKQKAVTPSTADSTAYFSLAGSKQGIHGVEFWDNQQLFISSQKKDVQSLSIAPSCLETITQKWQNQFTQIQGSNLGIDITFHETSGQKIKELNKQAQKILEDEKKLTFVFQRQYQFVQIEQNLQIFFNVRIKTFDGFNRQLWKYDLRNYREIQKWQILSIFSEDRQLSLKLEVERINEKLKLKPISFDLPLEIIDKFLEQKFKLLNKHEQLNQIKNLRQLKGIFHSLSKQNMGSRILQKLLLKANYQQINNLIQELKPVLSKMALDNYGNYVIQKIFQVSCQEQKKMVLQSLKKDIYQISITKSGTFCLQSILYKLDQASLILISQLICPHIKQISMNQYGSHFIKQLLQIYFDNQIVMSILNNFKQTTCDKYGVVIVKTILKLNVYFEAYRHYFIQICQKYFDEIIADCYGHYIIQELMVCYNYTEIQNIICAICQKCNTLSLNQFSSSVIKKSIEVYGDYVSVTLINNILQNGLKDMMQSSSGCFILHRLMQSTQQVYLRNILIGKMKSETNDINNYNKRIKWRKFFNLD